MSSLPAPRIRRHVSPPNNVLSEPEARILAWANSGAGLHAAAQLADVRLCRVEDWIEQGRANPRGQHGEFSRQIQAFQPAPRPDGCQSNNFDVPRGMRARAGRNGHGTVYEAEAKLVRWYD
jgi:hypothetical protein